MMMMMIIKIYIAQIPVILCLSVYCQLFHIPYFVEDTYFWSVWSYKNKLSTSQDPYLPQEKIAVAPEEG